MGLMVKHAKESFMAKLTREFYNRPTVEVAIDLLGKVINFKGIRGIITETEAYVGHDDPACHAARGLTSRTEVMFGPPGFSYVYLIYGMYYCLNIVTEAEGFPAAALIRGLFLAAPPFTHLNGPGKLCRELGITKDHNKIDVVSSNEFYLEDSPHRLDHLITPRIGIKVGTDKLWRFVASPATLKTLLTLHSI